MTAKPSLLIIGAGGHGKVVAECAEATGRFQTIVFLDSNFPSSTSHEHWPIIGHTDSIEEQELSTFDVFIAIGNNQVRQQFYDKLTGFNATLATLIHPSAYVSPYSTIGEGTLVAAHATINPFSIIGHNCIINTASSIDHDCHIQNHVHIAPGANLAGTINVGEQSFIGIGSRIIPGIKIGKRAVVGAGSTVIRDVPDDITVAGTPAKTLK